ncbi:hypothetical protein OH491_24920 [Termitidicoccus mucosus]|uniref:Uncharacterized protein n=1 Tax=Termitidicoccus mucosus TaxID=1184151 RepID=A0A178IQR1_9BACT|nr:hypothetical protein AW736_01615 [Opitutaceae bacterium TSB47]
MNISAHTLEIDNRQFVGRMRSFLRKPHKTKLVTTMTLKKALWFSRHEPTPGQLASARDRGFEIINIPEGKLRGAAPLNSVPEGMSMLCDLLDTAQNLGASACFGVFPTAFLAAHFKKNTNKAVAVPLSGLPDTSRPLRLFASITTPVQEGGSPSLTHVSWEQIA